MLKTLQNYVYICTYSKLDFEQSVFVYYIGCWIYYTNYCALRQSIAIHYLWTKSLERFAIDCLNILFLGALNHLSIIVSFNFLWLWFVLSIQICPIHAINILFTIYICLSFLFIFSITLFHLFELHQVKGTNLRSAFQTFMKSQLRVK